MSAPFAGKIALVTGASRGIGRAVALELAARGADVVVNYLRQEDAALQTVSAVEALGRRAKAVQANVGEPEELAALVAQVGQFGEGRLDFFVHNAALGTFKPTLQLRQNQFDLSMNINARSLLGFAQGLLPFFKRGQGASIVALSSRGAARVLPDYAAVGVSKAALEALVRYLAVALAPEGVRINALSAGLIDTDAIRAFKDVERIKGDVAARTPLGRMGTPEDVARAVAMLCHPDAGFITGQVIVADGGFGLL